MQSDLVNTHVLLLTGNDLEEGRKRVELHFEKNMLVKYDRIEIVADESYNAADSPAEFNELLEWAANENADRRSALISELMEEGYGDLADWQNLPQGYVSKIVHTLAHLLDGFFGVDSVLYNVINDSHHVSDVLMDRIRRSPEEFWLIKVKGYTSRGRQADRVPFLRKHGKE